MKKLLGIFYLLISSLVFSSAHNKDFDETLKSSEYKLLTKQWIGRFKQISDPNLRTILLEDPTSMYDPTLPESVRSHLYQAHIAKRSVTLHGNNLSYPYKMALFSQAAHHENTAYLQYCAYLKHDINFLTFQANSLLSRANNTTRAISGSVVSLPSTGRTTNVSELSSLTSNLQGRSTSSSIASNDSYEDTNSNESTFSLTKSKLDPILSKKLQFEKAYVSFVKSQESYVSQVNKKKLLQKRVQIQEKLASDLALKFTKDSELSAKLRIIEREKNQNEKQIVVQRSLADQADRVKKTMIAQEVQAIPAIIKLQAGIRRRFVLNNLAQTQQVLRFNKEKEQEKQLLAKKIARDQEEKAIKKQIDIQNEEKKRQKSLIQAQENKKQQKIAAQAVKDKKREEELLSEQRMKEEEARRIKKQKEKEEQIELQRVLELENKRQQKLKVERERIQLAVLQARQKQEEYQKLSESIYNSLVVIINNNGQFIDIAGNVTIQAEDVLYLKIKDSMRQCGVDAEIAVRKGIISPAINLSQQAFPEAFLRYQTYNKMKITDDLIEPTTLDWLNFFRKYQPDFTEEQIMHSKEIFKTVLTESLELQYRINERTQKYKIIKKNA